MGWKEKEYKANQKAKANQDEDHPYDSEMLRIQGLIRCQECENPYPFMHPRCPTCDSPNREHYPNKV
jgi:hypothetical protein